MIMNVGVAKYTYSMAEDDESSISVNVVRTFLLGLLLLAKLRETAARYNVSPHRTITTSNVHSSLGTRRNAVLVEIWQTWSTGTSTFHHSNRLMIVVLLLSLGLLPPYNEYEIGERDCLCHEM